MGFIRVGVFLVPKFLPQGVPSAAKHRIPNRHSFVQNQSQKRQCVNSTQKVSIVDFEKVNTDLTIAFITKKMYFLKRIQGKEQF